MSTGPRNNTKLIVKKIKYGSVLRIKAEKQTFKFKLTGTKAALERLLTCVKVARGSSGGRRNPFGAGGAGDKSNPFGGGNDTQWQDRTGKQTWGRSSDPVTRSTEGMNIARNLIRRIGDNRFRLLDPVPKRLRRLKADAVWKSPGGFGSITTLPGRYSADALRRALARQNRKSCRGNFRAVAEIRYIGGKTKSPVIKVACSQSVTGKPFFINYAFYRKKGKGSFRIMHFSTEPEGSNEADQTMYREIEKILVAARSK